MKVHELPPPVPPAETIKMRPTPIRTRVVHLADHGRTYTAIARDWGPGDAQRCPLCSKCRAYGDGCLYLVRDFISKADAPAFSTFGYEDRTVPLSGLRVATDGAEDEPSPALTGIWGDLFRQIDDAPAEGGAR